MNQRTRMPRERWSALEKLTLIKAHQAGKTPTDIYREGSLIQPRRKWSAIVLMWQRLGLSRRASKKRAPSKQWTAEEKQEFDNYLGRYSFSKTPEEIAIHWEVHKNTVIKWQKRLKVRPTREQVMAMSTSRAKQKHGRERQRQAKQLKTLTWKQRTSQALTARAKELRQREHPPEEQRCRTCRTSWPKRRKFFRFNDHHTKMGTYRWYRKDCVLCEQEKRNAKSRKATG